jgi:hypothetical protein
MHIYSLLKHVIGVYGVNDLLNELNELFSCTSDLLEKKYLTV